MHFTFGEVQTFVSDLGRAIVFYRDILGLNLKQESDSWAIFDISGVEFVLLAGAQSFNKGHYGEKCGTVLCLKSDSIEAAICFLKEKNVAIVQETKQVPQGKYAVISDPDGNFIEIIQH